MENAEYRKTLLLHAAQAFATSHGIFYAAAFLADNNIPIQVALKVLVYCRSIPVKTHLPPRLHSGSKLMRAKIKKILR